MILRDQLNVLVHLRPAPVVARVAGTIARVRPGATGSDASSRSRGTWRAPARRWWRRATSCRPGPHDHDGHVSQLLAHVESEPASAVDPAAAGAALRDCHEALRSFSGSLPVLSGVTEAEALLMKLAAEEALDREAATSLLHRIEDLHATLGSLRAPIQPLHGDAHLNNVLNGPDGPLWNDWEDTCVGPLGWDAACLKLTRDGGERAEAALAASGIHLDPGELSLWVEARSLQVAVWRAFLATS